MNCWPEYKDPGPNNLCKLITACNSSLGIIPFDRDGEATALHGKLASPLPILYLLCEKWVQADLQPVQLVRVWVIDFTVITVTYTAEESAQQDLYILVSAWRVLWALRTFLKYDYCGLIVPSFKATKYTSQMNCMGYFPLCYCIGFQTSTLILQHIGAKHIGLEFFTVLSSIFAGKVLLKLGLFFLFFFFFRASIH